MYKRRSARKGEGLAALDSLEDSPPAWAWRPSARRRVTVSALTLLAVGLAIVVVATGPPGPVTYEVRLPLLVLAGGVLVNATQWRRGVCITPDEVVVRTLVRIRRIPLPAVATVETDGSRVTIRTLGAPEGRRPRRNRPFGGRRPRERRCDRRGTSCLPRRRHTLSDRADSDSLADYAVGGRGRAPGRRGIRR